MRSKSTTWFETKVRYEKMQENGLMKKVTEQYVVDAMTFTEAETAIYGEMSSFIAGDFFIAEIKRAVYNEIFFSDNPSDDRWYKAKLAFITLDEKTSTEKKTIVYYLVQAATFEGARKAIDDVMAKTLVDYAIDTISETKILDVYEHNKPDHCIEEVDITVKGNKYNVLNCRLAKPVIMTYKETFKDENTGEEVEIERKRVIVQKHSCIDEVVMKQLLEADIKSVHIYSNDPYYSKPDNGNNA